MTTLEQLVLALREERDEPFCAYLYDLAGLRQHVVRLTESLPADCRLYYAVKANPDEKILRTLSPLVDGFEVASLGEIEKVRAVHQAVPIVFGGPGKTDGELAGAIRHGVRMIHVESVHELLRLERIAHKHGAVVSILLRVNLRSAVPSAQLNMAGVPTQFGIDEVDIPHVITMAVRSEHLRLEGFHFHAMSNNLDAQKHALFVQHCLETAKAWVREYGLQISCLNVGGGIGINYQEPDRQFAWQTFRDRLEEICRQHNEYGWEILFECGRYIASSCGTYAAEVLDIKRNHGKWFAVLRGGSHHFRLPAAWKSSHPFAVLPVEEWKYPFARPACGDTTVMVAGELCTPNDLLARDVYVPRLRAGDILLFPYAGAYGWTISHHDFLSHPHPEQIYLEE
jgi:diaminopimelate decarboxylase